MNNENKIRGGDKTKTKEITTIMLTLLLASMLSMAFNAVPVSASPSSPVTFYTVGEAAAEWSTEQKKEGDCSVKLYVKDGTEDWAEVSIPVDIAIEDIYELKFWEYIESYAPNGWDVNVVLGVDCDGDGFEADVAGWHVVSPHEPTMLGDDSFVEMDGALGGNPPTGAGYEINAFNTAQWWTPNAAGDGFDPFYGTLDSFISSLPVGRVEAGDRVKVIKLVIGGSSNWMEETAYVDYAVVNGVTIFDEPTAEDVIAILKDLKTEIKGLDPASFKKPKLAAQRKKTLCNKINAVIHQIEDGAYKGAIKKLEKDIRPKLDRTTKQSWVVADLSTILGKINLIISILGS